MSKLTIDQMGKLNTKRLLAYYRSERNKLYAIVSRLTYNGDICLGDVLYCKDENDPDIIEYDQQEKFCEQIKAILDTKENV